MKNLKANYKGTNNSTLCSSCNNSDESQEHIYNDCKEIMKESNYQNQEIPDYKSYNNWQYNGKVESFENIYAKNGNPWKVIKNGNNMK